MFSYLYIKRIKEDMAFLNWTKQYRLTSKIIHGISTGISFKAMRFFYSRFFGLDNFWAAFDEAETFHRPMNFVSIFNMVTTSVPIILVDIVALPFHLWGTQLYIVMIESVVICSVLLIMTVIEFNISRIHA